MGKGRIIDLDLVNISVNVYQAWKCLARQAVKNLAARGILLRPEEIPDEQGRLETDGSLIVFVVLPNGEEVSLRVPPGQWAWRFPKN